PPAAELRLLQEKYPDGLWCTSPLPCEHRLIATTRAGWARSFPEAFLDDRPACQERYRLACRDDYVCAECRQAAAERERVAQIRREQAAAARAVAARNRRESADNV